MCRAQRVFQSTAANSPMREVAFSSKHFIEGERQIAVGTLDRILE